MMTPLHPESPYPIPPRDVPLPRTPAIQPAQTSGRAIAFDGRAGARRLPDFSIFIPREPLAALPGGVPASTLRRSGFVL
jgi:hypothetical protein